MNMNILPCFTLLCPGPVNVTEQVAEAYSNCALSHREDNFMALLRGVQHSLTDLAGVASNSAEYTALLITGSGTAANEAVLASGVAPQKTVVVLSNGEFGERLGAISSVYNKTEIIKSEWAEPLDLAGLKVLLANGGVELVAMVHHETSTGLLNPVVEVGRLCKRYGVKFFVDGVSSFSADPISIVEAGITFLTTSSGKAIASYPGLSFVIGRHDSFAELADYPVKNHYLNLNRYYRSLERSGQTPNTPATSLIAAVHAALQGILREGTDERYKRLKRLAECMRFHLAERGLYAQKSNPESVVVTNVLLPKGMKFSDLQQHLRRHGFLIYDTKGPLRGRYFQVSTIGNISNSDISRFITVLDNCLPETNL